MPKKKKVTIDPFVDEMRKVQGRADATRLATKRLCPHKMNQGKSSDSALVLVKRDFSIPSFIVCQCCERIIRPEDSDWTVNLAAATKPRVDLPTEQYRIPSEVNQILGSLPTEALRTLTQHFLEA